MKRWIGIFVAALWMICMLPMASASETGLRIASAEAQKGETVYLVVSLHEEVTGDAMAVTYSYDSAVLKPLADQCKWAKKGALSDFDTNDRGVWAAGKTQNLKGDICTLAFQVLENADFSKTEIQCTLLVKAGANVAGEFEAAGSVSLCCNHDFGPWESQGFAGHSQVCKTCGFRQTSGHGWDAGVLTDDPEHENMCLFTRTCAECGETNVQSVSAEVKDNSSGSQLPEETTEPRETGVTKPPETYPQPTKPGPGYEETIYVEEATEATSPRPDHSENEHSGNQQGGTSKPAGSSKPAGTQQGSTAPNSGNGNTGSLKNDSGLQGSSLERPVNPESTKPTELTPEEKAEEHFHSHDEAKTPLPTISPEEIPVCTDPSHDHTHTHDAVQESGIKGASVAVIAAAVLAMGIATYMYLKKKRIFR